MTQFSLMHQLPLMLFRAHIYDCEMLHVTTESSDDDHLTMEDLISYSFQVAKGMEFLSSRKVKLQFFRNLCVCMKTSKIGDNNCNLCM